LRTPEEVAVIQELRRQGMGIKRIAQEAGCNLRTVRRYLDQGEWRGYARREMPGLDRPDEIGRVAQAVVVFNDNAIGAMRLRQEQQEAEARAIAAEKRESMEALVNTFEAEVGELVKTITLASTELNTTAQSMSSIAEETSRQSQTVASAAEQASANVQTAASAAEELSTAIAEVSRQVAQAGEKVRAARQEADSAGGQLETLNDAAQQIGEVVQLTHRTSPSRPTCWRSTPSSRRRTDTEILPHPT